MLARMMRRAKTSGRVDDTTEIFQRRYARHMDDVSSIVDALSRIGKGNDVVHVRELFLVLFLKYRRDELNGD